MTARTRPAEITTIWNAIRHAPIQPEAWLALTTAYAQHNLPWQAHYAARQAARIDPSVEARINALNLGPWHDTTRGDAELGRATLPGAEAMVARFSAWLDACPGDWLTWLYRARLAEMTGVQDAALAATRARETEFLPGETHHWLGVWRLAAGDAQGAREALATLPATRHGSMMFLAEALLRLGDTEAAMRAFTAAGRSSNPALLTRLATKLYAQNYWQEAISTLRGTLSLRPDDITALMALATIQSQTYELEECRATLDHVLRLDPGHEAARLLEAGLLGRMGEAGGDLDALLRAYEAGGDKHSRLVSSIAMTSLYQDTMTPREIADLHRRLCALIEAEAPPAPVFANSREPDRRLTVGFVSSDLHRQHPVNLFILPILRRLSRDHLDVRVYHGGTMFDEYTRQAQAAADGWAEVAALDDTALRDTIRRDGVDILIDLAGHTSSHRLGVFTQRAAPVQVTFLGYPHSTGLGAMDWLIGDPIVSPDAHAELFSERLARLPDSVFCWAPVDEYPVPPPRPSGTEVVFGSFNNAMKLSPRTVALWARVLHAAPGATLLLKAPSLRDVSIRDRFAARFAEHGIAAEWLMFRGPTELGAMMAEYGDLDIALDPLPYGGGTTTVQALWMGVPVVSLEGGNFTSRMGSSFLHALGRPDWVARDEDSYIEITRRLATEVSALRTGRAALRETMRRSPLGDIETYVRQFEALLRRIWALHCAEDGARGFTLERGEGDGSALRHQRHPRARPGDLSRHGAGTGPRDKPGADDTATVESWVDQGMGDQNPSEGPAIMSFTSTVSAPTLEMTTSRQFLSWMAEQALSIGVTSRASGKLFLLGLKPDRGLSVFDRAFPGAGALCATENGFRMAARFQVWRFENVLDAGQVRDGYDRIYVPRVGHTTGALDIQDLGVDHQGRVVFVNTLFNCLATLSETHSFQPLWRPRFISNLVAEDRCHLTGVALRSGVPSHVTAAATTNEAGGWRRHRANGGIVIDVTSHEIVATGLSMPRAPRWYRDRLWLLNAGSGEFGHVDPASGVFEPVTFCAGHLRGLAFHGDFALITTSLSRPGDRLDDLPLGANLAARGASTRCGVQVVDLRTGDTVHWLRVEGVVAELDDVMALAGARRPMALGFRTDEIERVLSVGDSAGE